MVSYRATVRNGRIELDEPAELVEGQAVSIVVEDDHYAHLDDADDLDDEERAKLHAAIDKGIEDGEAGRTHGHEEVLRAMGKPD